ncbi:MAG: hypothetical protein GY792_13235 [Gammaproteobacteria bacterium]|nr:hypothetical protein [Gammaproteobacteria bacterium]
MGALVSGNQLELVGQVAECKASWDRLKQETPPPMMPLKERIMGFKTDVFIPHAADAYMGNILKGVATSMGTVTAPERTLRGPEDFGQMRPGDVLVTGTTTPAWTPLFAMASAVVTDVGGPFSHGSIVTGVSTKRIHNKQTITVNDTKDEGLARNDRRVIPPSRLHLSQVF